MPDKRFYTHARLIEGSTILLNRGEHHHLVHVMRQKVGKDVEIVNGEGLLVLAKITKISKQETSLVVGSLLQKEDQLKPPLIISQAIPRLNRLDTILEKGTELGMDEIWLFPGEKSERTTLSANQMERLEGIAIAAMKQCGRLHLPKIILKPPLLKQLSLPCPAYFGDTDRMAPRFSSLFENNLNGTLFYIGPEGGFSHSEKDHLQKLGALGVSLHSNILRTDTASLVALSIMTH
ncbi:MAG: 16S rRNA (uracil(1498)-N(3))-methyltransferase [Chlamydiia bacterium]|nr:16S rRNA (uracil(1498)-N(3))-methyltransferase [Chlamydiia bacterium]